MYGAREGARHHALGGDRSLGSLGAAGHRERVFGARADRSLVAARSVWDRYAFKDENFHTTTYLVSWPSPLISTVVPAIACFSGVEGGKGAFSEAKC